VARRRFALAVRNMLGFFARRDGAMRVSCFRNGVTLAWVLLVTAIAMTDSARAQSEAELKELNQRVIELYQAGKYVEAVPLAERYAEGLRDGQTVTQGQVIGYVGMSGRSTGAHLHYEVRIHDTPVNPHKYLRNVASNVFGGS
jgi:septal ring factor EnvC (AmiA/AmiB activator)